MTIAARLQEERNRLGMNQTEFAQLGGVGKTTQINYEKGERFPDAAFLAAVSSAGVDVLYVVTGRRASATELSPDENMLLTRLRQGSPVLQGYLRESGFPSAGAGGEVNIAGDVGQQIGGGATFTAPITFSMDKKRR